MALPVSLSGLSTAVACAGPFKIAAGTYDLPSGAIDINLASNGVLTGAVDAFGQGVTLDSTFTLKKLGTYFHPGASPVGTIWAEVRSGGGLTGTLLATSDSINADSVTSSVVVTEFNFPSPATLSASTLYTVIVKRSDTSTTMTLPRQSGNPYAGGISYTRIGGVTTPASDHDLKITLTPAVTVSADAYYFFGRDSGTASALDAYKATDPTSSWAQQATVSATSTIVMLAGYQVGDVIHLVISGGTGDYRYVTYDMVTDAFGTVETIQTGLSIAGQVSATPAASIVVRSDGVVVVLYQGATASVMGNARARIRYASRATNGTWTTAVVVDAEGAFDWVRPEAGLGASDRAHFFWRTAASGSVITFRTLNSSNALQTESTYDSGNTNSYVHQLKAYNDSGTVRLVGVNSVSAVLLFDSADVPTVTPETASLGTGNTTPGAIFNDGADFWRVARASSNSDLYAIKSTDFGDTFSGEANIFAGTVASVITNLSRDGNIYQRGNDFVIPYVVNDNGTLKYNEYVVRSEGGGGTAESLANSGTVRVSGRVPIATASAHKTALATAGAAEITGATPFAFAADSKTALANAGAVSVSGQQPVADATANTISLTVSGALEAVGQTPVAIVTANVAALAESGEAQVTGSQPVAVASANVSALAEAGAIQIAGAQPVAAATASVSSLAGTGTVSISGAIPVAVATENATALAQSGAATLVGSTPVAVSTANVSALAEAGTIEITGALPVAVATANVTALVQSGSIVATGSTPESAVTANVSALAQSGTAEFAGQTPLATVTANVTALAEAGTVEIAGSIPFADAIAGVTATPVAGTIEVEGQQPLAVVTEHVTALAESGSIEVTGQIPVANATANVEAEAQAGTIEVAGQIPVAAITANVAALAEAGSVEIAGQTPVAVTTSNVEAVAEPGSIEIEGQTPTAAITSNVYSFPDGGLIQVTGSVPVAASASPAALAIAGSGSISVVGSVPVAIGGAVVEQPGGGVGRRGGRRGKAATTQHPLDVLYRKARPSDFEKEIEREAARIVLPPEPKQAEPAQVIAPTLDVSPAFTALLAEQGRQIELIVGNQLADVAEAARQDEEDAILLLLLAA